MYDIVSIIYLLLICVYSKGSEAGQLNQASALSKTHSVSKAPGKWVVSFSDLPVWNHFPYWILEVGGLSPYKTCYTGVTSCYAWAIVSDPIRSSLFILARDVDEFKSKYESTALAIVKAKGFDLLYNSPIEVFQSSTECTYAALPY